MLIAVLASTMTAATPIATAFGLFEEAERSCLPLKRVASIGSGRRAGFRPIAAIDRGRLAGMSTPLHLAMCVLRAAILLSPAAFAVTVLLLLFYR
ncbi:hypothetical protein SAMN03159463_02697 [Mesorhizobium sp. NFR06]|uniref:hypothetical protein n=1 Tax=Mesorhizobium sp. NFR06 TaxID=1566290 RepID=UPI0008EE4190|nr:hypothetical protein [Mesorhizobium sp. NFR06]SFO68962.1 hypothetical protein SAMN03159463_02697 [Mesorhizobium sp. NFR06]